MGKRKAPAAAKGKAGPHKVAEGTYSAMQVARLFKVTLPTVYAWVARGELVALPSFPPSSKRPRRRFDKAKIDEILEGLKAAS